jgi:hypothetical protein
MILDEHNHLNDLNDFVKQVFADFLLKAQNELFIDEIIPTCVYDSYADSLELYEQDHRNPIFNFHEFGIAGDFNIVKDGRRFMKYQIIEKDGSINKNNVPEEWEKTGWPDLAVKLGLRWGGTFKGYPDCVHIDAANILLKKYNLNSVIDLLNYLKSNAFKEFGQDLTKVQLNKMVL